MDEGKKSNQDQHVLVIDHSDDDDDNGDGIQMSQRPFIAPDSDENEEGGEVDEAKKMKIPTKKSLAGQEDECSDMRRHLKADGKKAVDDDERRKLPETSGRALPKFMKAHFLNNGDPIALKNGLSYRIQFCPEEDGNRYRTYLTIGAFEKMKVGSEVRWVVPANKKKISIPIEQFFELQKQGMAIGSCWKKLDKQYQIEHAKIGETEASWRKGERPWDKPKTTYKKRKYE